MANMNVNYAGQINGAGAVDALQLKLWAGEVIVSFNAKCVFQDKQQIRHITGGKSATFPATGKLTADYHSPGAEITGSTSNSNERVITIDDLLLASTFLSNIDEAKTAWDVRAPLMDQLGDALAQAYDKNIAQVGCLAARAGATISGQVGGAQVTTANMDTDGAVLGAGIYTATQKMDEANVPDGGRYVFLKPAQFYLISQVTNFINTLYGGRGSIASGTIEAVAGITIVKTNNLPNGKNIVSGPSAYQGDFTKSVGLVMNDMAVGTVKLLDLGMESQYMVNRQGTLLIAKFAMGSGILRPHCAVELLKP